MFKRLTHRRRINRPSGAKQSLTFGAVTALVLTPLAVVGAGTTFDLVQENGSGPIDPVVQTVSLTDSQSVLVDDAAIATQSIADDEHPNRGVVKEITSETEFSQFALTWRGSADMAGFVRAQRADGTWSEWYDAEPMYPAEGEGNGLNGTELLFVEPTKRIQVSSHGLNIFGPESELDLETIRDAEELRLDEEAMESLQLELTQPTSEAAAPSTPPAQTPTEELPETSQSEPQETPAKWTDIKPVAEEDKLGEVNAVLIDGQAAATAINPIVDAKNVTGMPRVITRAGWGANEANRCSRPTYDSKLVGATVHHTAGSNNYTEAQAAGVVRGIFHYHAQTLGWCDIGYQALVDKFGNIYEGRYGGLDKNVQGAHAGGFNTGTFGISMMGDYSRIAPSEATLNAMGNMIGWRLKVAGLQPNSSVTMTSGGTNYAKHPYGKAVTLPRIFAHRDVGNTSCPGDVGYSQMGKIRSIALAKYNNLNRGIINNNPPSGDTGLTVPPISNPGGSGSGVTSATVTSTATKTTTTTATATKSSTEPQPTTRTSAPSTSAPSASATRTATSATSTTRTTTPSRPSMSSSSSSSSSSAAPTSSTGSSNGANAGDGASNTTSTSQPSASATAPMTTEPTPNPNGGSTAPTGLPSSPSNPVDTQAALEAITGARSMLASALGLLGAPGLGETADAILAAVGRSIENGPSIDDLPVLVQQIMDINAKNDLAAEWRSVNEQLGNVLGYALSGIQGGATVANNQGKADQLRYVKFSNGVITDSDTTGTHAIWGAIADEWARQGFEVGSLGAPTATQRVVGNTEVAEFQNGTITLDRATGAVKTQLK